MAERCRALLAEHGARGRDRARPGDARLLAGGRARADRRAARPSRESSSAIFPGPGCCAPRAASGRARTTSNASFGGFSSPANAPKRDRMPRFLRGLVLAGALGCWRGAAWAGRRPATPPSSRRSRRRSSPPWCCRRPSSATIAEGLRPARRLAARSANAEAADDTLDPERHRQVAAKRGPARAATRAYYGDGDLAALEEAQGVVSSAPRSSCWRTRSTRRSTCTSSWATSSASRASRTTARSSRRVSSFEVTGVGDEAAGLLARPRRREGASFTSTAVAFRRERVIGVAVVARADRDDAQGEARALAVKLDKRIQDVLAGRIEAEPGAARGGGRRSRSPSSARRSSPP